MKAKRVVALSDLHCGHDLGLCPPQYNIEDELYDVRKETWDWFSKEIRSLGKIDILFIVGDSIDGKGERSGGTEQLTTDRMKQVKMAVDCIRFIKPQKIFMAYGTPYHTGMGEDWEAVMAKSIANGGEGTKRIKTEIGGHLFVDVNGCIFDLKHKVSTGKLMHTKGTSISREKLQNYMWMIREQQPNSDIIIRGHVHNFFQTSDGYWVAMTLPGLQGLGSKYGERQCSGVVNLGFVHFDINTKGGYTWQSHLAELPGQKAPVLKA